MNARERFMAQMRFERVDRPLRYETLGFWGKTTTRWHEEGLPADVSPAEYFEMEVPSYLPVNCGFTSLGFVPPFDRKELERTERSITYQDQHGVVFRQRAENAETSMPQWLKFPVEKRSDWDRIRDERLDPDSPERYPDWGELRQKYRNSGSPVGITICGGYGTPRSVIGEEKLALMYFDDPDLLHEIMRWWLDFYKRVLTIVTDNFGALDFVLLWEDMAFKTGPLISPQFVKQFMMPYYEPLIEHVNSCGTDIVWLDTDGNAEVLLDLFVNSGVTALCPFEIAAGMEPLPIRQKFGEKLAMIGGVDKRAVAEGGDVMRAEVMRKVPQLLDSGGYIPGIDHATPPDTSFDDHRAFVDLIRELGVKHGG
jgi:hypothetical protein